MAVLEITTKRIQSMTYSAAVKRRQVVARGGRSGFGNQSWPGA